MCGVSIDIIGHIFPAKTLAAQQDSVDSDGVSSSQTTKAVEMLLPNIRTYWSSIKNR